MLLLDAGNSRIKWALARNGVWLHQGVAPTGDATALRLAFTDLPPPHRILASNVAGESVARQIQATCAEWHCAVEFITAREEQCGVRNGYAQTAHAQKTAQNAQLGSDRWAALIAAWSQGGHQACLVVNCGTATTVDALSAQGEFIGGLILPGVDMMRRSLATGTAQLEMAQGEWRQFPRNTADAIYSGAVKATTGAIREQYQLLGAPGARCILSGGAASHVEPHLGLPMLRVEDLVLHGLQLIGQETE